MPHGFEHAFGGLTWHKHFQMRGLSPKTHIPGGTRHLALWKGAHRTVLGGTLKVTIGVHSENIGFCRWALNLKCFWMQFESLLRAPRQHWQRKHDISTPAVPAAHDETLGSYSVAFSMWLVLNSPSPQKHFGYFTFPHSQATWSCIHCNTDPCKRQQCGDSWYIAFFGKEQCGYWLCTKKKPISIAHHSFPLGSLILHLPLQHRPLQGTAMWRFLVAYFGKEQCGYGCVQTNL